ncbi:MAG: hypothetical protein Q9162_003025 [Coniocarpon cinnabarinum]
MAHSQQESRSGEIDLSEEDEEAVEHMVHYFYHLDYLVSEEPEEEEPSKPITKTRFTLHDFEDPLVATATAVSTDNQQAPASSRPPIAVGSIIPMPLPSPKKPRSRSPSPRRPSRRRASSKTVTNPHTRLRKNSELKTAQSLGFSATRERHGEFFQGPDVTSDLVIHARVYALGEKYGVQGLKTLAREKFEVLVAQHWNEADFLDAVVEVYSSTVDKDRGMRNVVLQAFRQRPELAARQDVQAILQEVPSLAFDIKRMSNGIPITS